MEAFLANLPEGTTTINIACTTHTLVAGLLYDTTISEAKFMDTVERLRHQGYPVVEKRFKRYSHMNYVYTVSEDASTDVVKEKLLRHIALEDKHLLVCAMRSEAAQDFMFPWSDQLHDIAYITRVSFKLPWLGPGGFKLNMHLDACYDENKANVTYRAGFTGTIGRDYDAAAAAKTIVTSVNAALKYARL